MNDFASALTTSVPRVLLFATLAGPTPSGSTNPSRLCQGCSRPPRHHPDQAALNYIDLLRQAEGGGLSPPLETQRLAAQKGMITPIRKPSCRELLDWEKNFNTAVNQIRYMIERTIANLKTWRILHTDYRRPLATFTTTISTVIGLHFYAINCE
jgi:hypothetical protein